MRGWKLGMKLNDPFTVVKLQHLIYGLKKEATPVEETRGKQKVLLHRPEPLDLLQKYVIPMLDLIVKAQVN